MPNTSKVWKCSFYLSYNNIHSNILLTISIQVSLSLPYIRCIPIFRCPYLYLGLSYHIALNSLTMPFASNSKHCLICMYLTPFGIGGLGYFFSIVLNRAFLVHWSPCCRYLSKVRFTSHHVVDDVISASCYV